jgi:hypothetical protein
LARRSGRLTDHVAGPSLFFVRHLLVTISTVHPQQVQDIGRVVHVGNTTTPGFMRISTTRFGFGCRR